jgi:NET1-associated nuclear protein 1 (U3 small nucleolar RNA-associated protein 17)
MSSAEEDVLLISQVHTGNRQFVPRLGAPIISINQTKSGSLYSINLANNKIKIINAADLELKSEVSGIQPMLSPLQKHSSSDTRHLPVALLHPQGQLYTNGSSSSTSSGTLQSYNVELDQESLRLDVAQITRTKSVGKEKRQVIEPIVRFASFTGNGNWLATVDEWENQYALDDIGSRDISLKFWFWNGKQWSLTTKIQGPHGDNHCVLSLASLEGKSEIEEFATLGAEGSVKVWRPSRRRHRGPAEAIWSLHGTLGSPTTVQSQGSLVYSPDGSLLLAGVGNNIFVADISNSRIVKCLHVGQSISQLAILRRYVLCLHDDSSLVSAWDLGSGQIIFTDRVDRAYARIAVNHTTSTFAVVSSSSEKATIVISRIVQSRRIEEAQISFNSTVTALLSSDLAAYSPGYISVDDSGNISVINREHSVSSTASMAADPAPPTFSILPASHTNLSGHKNIAAAKTNTISIDAINQILRGERSNVVNIYEAIVQGLS